MPKKKIDNDSMQKYVIRAAKEETDSCGHRCLSPLYRIQLEAIENRVAEVYEVIRPYIADYSMILRRVRLLEIEADKSSKNHCKGCNCTKE